MHQTFVCAVAVACAAAVGGCAGSGRDNQAIPAVGLIQTITAVSQISLPLDAYHVTREDQILLRRAEFLLREECMRGSGVTNYVLAEPLDRFSRYDRKYGIFDRVQAASYGYHMRPAYGRASTEPELALAESQLDKRCLADARRTLAAGGALVDENFINLIAIEASERAEADPRVQEAFGDWSDCMKVGGFDYADPWEANDDSWSGDTASAREIAVAVADVECKLATNLIGIWMAVEAAYQDLEIEENAEALADHIAARERELDVAARIVS